MDFDFLIVCTPIVCVCVCVCMCVCVCPIVYVCVMSPLFFWMTIDHGWKIFGDLRMVIARDRGTGT